MNEEQDTWQQPKYCVPLRVVQSSLSLMPVCAHARTGRSHCTRLASRIHSKCWVTTERDADGRLTGARDIQAHTIIERRNCRRPFAASTYVREPDSGPNVPGVTSKDTKYRQYHYCAKGVVLSPFHKSANCRSNGYGKYRQRHTIANVKRVVLSPFSCMLGVVDGTISHRPNPTNCPQWREHGSTTMREHTTLLTYLLPPFHDWDLFPQLS